MEFNLCFCIHEYKLGGREVNEVFILYIYMYISISAFVMYFYRESYFIDIWNHMNINIYKILESLLSKISQ
jgi:hypothetical protein